MSAAIEAPGDFVHWLGHLMIVTPAAPLWLQSGVAAVLANRDEGSDGLLVVADVLTEAAHAAALDCANRLPDDLARLAELCRQEAPRRVENVRDDFA